MNTTSESVRQIKGILKSPATLHRDSEGPSGPKYMSWGASTQLPDWSSARDRQKFEAFTERAPSSEKKVNFWPYEEPRLIGNQRELRHEPNYIPTYTKNYVIDSKPQTNLPSANSTTKFERRFHEGNSLVEPSHPYIIESEDRGANYIDYRHYPPYEFGPTPYKLTSEYLDGIMRHGNLPPESWIHGLSGSHRHHLPRHLISEARNDHHVVPPNQQSRSKSPKMRSNSSSSHFDKLYSGEAGRLRRDYPELEHHPMYYGPDYLNYRHALARHPSMINEVDFKTCYHKLYEDTGSPHLISELRQTEERRLL